MGKGGNLATSSVSKKSAQSALTTIDSDLNNAQSFTGKTYSVPSLRQLSAQAIAAQGVALPAVYEGRCKGMTEIVIPTKDGKNPLIAAMPSRQYIDLSTEEEYDNRNRSVVGARHLRVKSAIAKNIQSRFSGVLLKDKRTLSHNKTIFHFLKYKVFLPLFAKLNIIDADTTLFSHVLPDGLGDYESLLITLKGLRFYGVTKAKAIVFLPELERGKIRVSVAEKVDRVSSIERETALGIQRVVIKSKESNGLFFGCPSPDYVVPTEVATKLASSKILFQVSHSSPMWPLIKENACTEAESFSVGQQSYSLREAFPAHVATAWGLDSIFEIGVQLDKVLQVKDVNAESKVDRLMKLSTALTDDTPISSKSFWSKI